MNTFLTRKCQKAPAAILSTYTQSPMSIECKHMKACTAFQWLKLRVCTACVSINWSDLTWKLIFVRDKQFTNCSNFDWFGATLETFSKSCHQSYKSIHNSTIDITVHHMLSYIYSFAVYCCKLLIIHGEYIFRRCSSLVRFIRNKIKCHRINIDNFLCWNCMDCEWRTVEQISTQEHICM